MRDSPHHHHHNQRRHVPLACPPPSRCTLRIGCCVIKRRHHFLPAQSPSSSLSSSSHHHVSYVARLISPRYWMNGTASNMASSVIKTTQKNFIICSRKHICFSLPVPSFSSVRIVQTNVASSRRRQSWLASFWMPTLMQKTRLSTIVSRMLSSSHFFCLTFGVL